jgi:hypothetical protein
MPYAARLAPRCFGALGESSAELVAPATDRFVCDHETSLDTYSKVAFAKLYGRKTPLPAADLLNDRVVPFFDSHGIPLARVLTDRGTKYCGNPEHHEYEFYLAIWVILERSATTRGSRMASHSFPV